jgi:hypothetical protein
VTGLTYTGTLSRPSYTDDGRLLLSWTTASGDSGGIDVEYNVNSGYYGTLRLANLSGVWRAAVNDDGSWDSDPSVGWVGDLPVDRAAELDIAADGSFAGTDPDGCQSAGRFDVIDARFSMFEVRYTISGCARAGEYSGLAMGDNGWYDVHSFVLSADDGLNSQALEFWQVAQ